MQTKEELLSTYRDGVMVLDSKHRDTLLLFVDELQELEKYLVESTEKYSKPLVPVSHDETLTNEQIIDDDYLRNNGFVLLGIREGKIIGMANCRDCGYEDTVYIGKVVVHPEHRKKGYGSQLMRFISLIAKKRGFKYTYLNVVAANVDAVSVYKKDGYRPQLLGLYKQL